MCAKEEPSAEAEIVRAIKPNSQRRFYHNISCRETSGYRSRNPGGSPLSRIVLNNLPEFEQWLKNPSDSRPRPHPAVITALEKFLECGVIRYGAVREVSFKEKFGVDFAKIKNGARINGKKIFFKTVIK